MGRDRESLCSLFHACDVDNSGQIEKYEFIQICSELNVPPTEREHIFSKLDTDRDGTINLAEFISGFLGISEQVYCGNMESESWEVSSPAWEDFQTRMGDHDTCSTYLCVCACVCAQVSLALIHQLSLGGPIEMQEKEREE
uniref:EF-hand domain-containing protein n=1 Tax=Oncorhynchus mykiss TaxID=8022 RepID=A0A8C7SZ49_ONCMY